MEGIRVLDVSERVAGAHCGRLLAEQGAETVLIEPPDGNPLRHRGPYADGDQDPEKSLEFAHYHLNKRGVTLDVEREEGRDLFDRLVETADVVVTDQPPDHPLREDLLDYDRLSSLNPEAIVVSITPYGLSGPRSDAAAADITIQSTGGFAQINGHPDRPPLRLPNNQAGHMGAINAMTGTLSAIFHREFNGGTGTLVDVSQQEAVFVHLEHHLQLETFDSYSPNPMHPEHDIGKRSGRFFTPGVPIGLFPCEDGWVCMAAAQEHEIQSIVEFFDTEKLHRLDEEGKLDDPIANRSQYGQEITEAIDEAAAEYTTEELEREGQEAGIAVSMVKDPAELLDDEHFEANGFIRTIDHPKIGEMADVGPGARTRTSSNLAFTPAPLLGEHNDDVYSELGLDADELREKELI